MKRDLIVQLTKSFEEAAHIHEDVEFWMARDLQVVLEYERWENFSQVIDKAKTACQKSGYKMADHFRDVTKTIAMPKGAMKEIDDMLLSRYACYLIAQNGDSRKETIAFAQTYFALQTRKQD
jgi:DNA-damage-inducible protein D